MKKLLSLLIPSALLLCVVSADSAPRKRFSVGDIAGRYYVASSSKTLWDFKSIRLNLVKTYKNQGFSQADFTGTIGDVPIVGQAIISGNQDGDDDFIRFDFMFLNPQDVTSHVEAVSTMKNGRVVGLKIIEEDGSNIERTNIVYRRVVSK